ncbi:hypothetical protein Bbelb_437740 [Branchiostoma belcheri]|nr:hypothetical protein Bbelb_437740 [Branchiostoma belcheri]
MAKPPQIPPARRAAERALPGRAPEPAPADELCSPHKIGFIAPCQLSADISYPVTSERRCSCDSHLSSSEILQSPISVCAQKGRDGFTPAGLLHPILEKVKFRCLAGKTRLLFIVLYRNSFEVEDIRVDITWGNIRGPVRVVYRTAAVVSDPQPTTNVFLLLDD